MSEKCLREPLGVAHEVSIDVVSNEITSGWRR